MKNKKDILSDVFFFGGEGGTRISFCYRKILLICSALGERKIIQFIDEKIFAVVYTRKSLRLKTIHRIVLLTPSSFPRVLVPFG